MRKPVAANEHDKTNKDGLADAEERRAASEGKVVPLFGDLSVDPRTPDLEEEPPPSKGQLSCFHLERCIALGL